MYTVYGTDLDNLSDLIFDEDLPRVGRVADVVERARHVPPGVLQYRVLPARVLELGAH